MEAKIAFRVVGDEGLRGAVHLGLGQKRFFSPEGKTKDVDEE
jgi:hypothetical protein